MRIKIERGLPHWIVPEQSGSLSISVLNNLGQCYHLQGSSMSASSRDKVVKYVTMFWKLPLTSFTTSVSIELHIIKLSSTKCQQGEVQDSRPRLTNLSLLRSKPRNPRKHPSARLQVRTMTTLSKKHPRPNRRIGHPTSSLLADSQSRKPQLERARPASHPSRHQSPTPMAHFHRSHQKS